ncbi:hypothetical protein BN8_01124 [Fibrisoma limi BUZ 3]|uniref:Lipocalin-like domain-containing protein n=1 Tax=Fibrisoma limi BUZ 3 TaxID=1185876 RepID=I2GE25_9BACT|nr:hypothetical protein [Fibrisoma limi]CCH52150.1 hypothetical protein BN8_01124 [Fibrisoma limi BUZ 3]
MKTKLLWLAIPLVSLSSCFQGDNGNTVDDANDAGGTGSPYLAREVSGTWLLSTDHRFAYDAPCNVLDEGMIQSTFNVGLLEELSVTDARNGCTFEWEGNQVSVAFGGPKPYPSIYHAEYIFDKMYQPSKQGITTGQMGDVGAESLFGPDPTGTVSERPPVLPTSPAGRDTLAQNDTATTVARIPPQATVFTEPAVNTVTGVAITGVGDKAIWEPAKNTLHVLYNNHILNLKVQTKEKPEVRMNKAVQLAGVLLSHFDDVNADLDVAE